MSVVTVRSTSPGRPKDPEKRAAILDAAKQLFPEQGFEGTSMDAIAAAAGVSKLTVYSHFNDKESLYMEALRERCSQQMPAQLFSVDSNASLRSQLENIARAFFALVTSTEALSLHRLLSSGNTGAPKLAQMFWEAGPKIVQSEFSNFLRESVALGRLDVPDVDRAASQFFSLVKGDLHARRLCGCGESFTQREIDEHLRATVDMFERAYATPAARTTR
ncbi:MAG: TetR/AcrR family transcriptional regulator [Dokdonella sp.]